MQRTQATENLIRVVQGVTSRISLESRTLVTEDDVAPIKQFMASLTPASVGLTPNAHEHITPPTRPGNIRYLHIAQVEDAYSIGVFVLPPGACIPLHNHPNMCVVSHILYGAVKITSYDRVREGISSSGAYSSSGSSGLMAFAASFGFGGGDGGGALAVLRQSEWHAWPYTSCLTEYKANVHQLEAGQQGVAILDVLIPPYDELRGRDCTYYRADRVAPVGAGAGAAAMGRGGGGGSWPFGGGDADAGQNALTVRLVPCSPGGNYAVVRGDFVAPFGTVGAGYGTYEG